MSWRPWVDEGIKPRRWLSWRLAWLFVYFTLGMVLRVRVTGVEKVPKKGGALLVANHTTFFDFLLAFYAVYRPCHGIGSEQVFRLPVGGFILRELNGIPFSKGAKDKAAVIALARAYKKGGIIGMFPEGLRSWTGEPLPVKRGTGRLVKSLGCPVIYCRISTGFMQHPRWAKWPRLVPWRMEVSEPEHFPEDATPEEINAAIERGIHMDPSEVPLPPYSFGWRLAEGLPNFLWGCPKCFAMEALEVPSTDRDTVVCKDCGASWRVTLDCQLVGEAGGATDTSVAEAHKLIVGHYPIDEPVSVGRLEVTADRRGERVREPVADGEGRLGEHGLEVLAGGEVVWSLPYDNMTAVLLQVGNKLQVRANGPNYQLTPHGHSTLRWHFFLQRRATGAIVA